MILAAALLALASSPAADALPAAPHGRYLEARTASVFAGPCHYNAELTTAGREALIAFAFEGGEWKGVPLAGARAVAAVAGSRNLDFEDATRASVLFLDAPAGERQREALRALLAERYAAVLGRVVEARAAAVELELGPDAYRLAVGEGLVLEGEPMPDRACCSMPSNVWYEPFVAADGKSSLAERLVGNSRVFRYDDALARGAEGPRWSEAVPAPRWTRRGNNDAFVGRFRVE